MSGAKPLLIVTPFFSPQSHAAVFRAHKLAKYLPEYGWQPNVVTVDTNYHFNEDPALLRELPPSVEIHTARYIETTLRGLRMALGGRSRTYRTLNPGGDSAEPQRRTPAARPSIATRGYNYLRHRYIEVPDEHRTWISPAVGVARRLIRAKGIRLVYTSGMPFSSHAIGLALKADGCRWVADFRDPMAHGAKFLSNFPAVARRQKDIVRRTLNEADAVTGTSAGYPLLMKDYFPHARQTMQYIPTGLDQALLPPDDGMPVRPWPYLIFTGEFQTEYDDYFFEVLSLAMRSPSVAAKGYRVIIAGHLTLNQARVSPRLAKYGLSDVVEFVPHQAQSGLYHLIRHSVATLLIPGHTSHWWNHFAKLVDYIALRKPVVAVVPDPSDARSALSKSGLGVFLDGAPEKAAVRLAEFLSNPSACQVLDDDVCEQHTVRRQVQAFAEIFERLTLDQ